MKCHKCKTDVTMLFTMISQTTNEEYYICAECLVESTPKIKDIGRLDEELEEIESTLSGLEELKKLNPQELQEQDSLSDHEKIMALFFTPAKAYDVLKGTYNNLSLQKMELFLSMPEADRLKYELKKAVEAENYEKAAELRDKLIELDSK